MASSKTEVLYCLACDMVSILETMMTDHEGDPVCPCCGGAGDCFPAMGIKVFHETPDVWPYDQGGK